MRIISLVPSLTELLYHLGADVAGITKFCVHPDLWYRTKPRIGGTKNPDIERIKALKPDVIIANKEENRKEDIEQLRQFAKVIVTDIKTLQDAYSNILLLGRQCNEESAALHIASKIEELWGPLYNTAPKRRALYLIWRNPYMAAGSDTYIHHVMTHIGLINAVDNIRYPTLGVHDIKALNPDIILLSTEPYPFKDKHLEEIRELVPDAHIRLVDGEAFSWYGYRMIPAAEYLYRFVSELNKIQ